ncbi:unnamed protein product [Brassica napus]|nr:unnamed protein product [Brassica napus]
MMSSSSSSATDTITKPSSLLLVESVTCDTCGFAEECTLAYIHRVKERHKGHWLCGLCAEAVKDEVVRSPTRISVEEALLRPRRSATVSVRGVQTWRKIQYQSLEGFYGGASTALHGGPPRGRARAGRCRGSMA